MGGYHPIFTVADRPTLRAERSFRCRNRVFARTTLALILMIGVVHPTASIAAPEGGAKRSQLKTLEHAIDKNRSRSKELDRKARDIATEAQTLGRALVNVARDARTHERAAARIRNQISTIDRKERKSIARLQNQRNSFSELLATLQRIARNPPEALVAYSASPRDTLRSAMLLKSFIPRLEARAAGLRAELTDLVQLREEAARRRQALEKIGRSLNRKRAELKDLLQRKEKLARITRKQHKRTLAATRALAAKAKNLRELLDRIKRDRKKRKAKARTAAAKAAKNRTAAAKAAKNRKTAARAAKNRTAVFAQARPGRLPSISRARGRLTTPVVGTLVDRYGKKRVIGTRSNGIRFATAFGAQVVAPHDGQVVFAGPFRGYGRLLIIDHGEGYHTLLAGLGRIHATINQRLLAGEPIGIMARAGKKPPRLYLELRRNGRPVDPFPWLETPPTDKVSG